MIRKLLYIFGGGLVAVVATLVGVRLYLTDARLTAIAQAQLKQHVPFPVSIEGISLSLRSGIVLKRIVVGPPTPAYHDNVAVIEEVRLGYSLAGLLDRQVKVTEVALDRASVVLEQQDGKWNVQAMGDAFASSGPKEPEPASQPSDGSTALPVNLDIEKVAVIDFAAQVKSPDLNASLDRVNLDVKGSYRGDAGQAVIGLHVGDDKQWARVRAAMKEKVQVELDTKLDCAVEAPSLKEAKVDCTWRIDHEQGKAQGYTIAAVPIDLKLKAQANLLTQNAMLETLSLVVGKAFSFEMAAKVREMMGDPEVGLDKLAVRVHLGPALHLAPRGLVPVTARGTVALDVAPLTARVSELQAQQPLDAGILLKLQNVDVATGDVAVDGLSGELKLDLRKTDGISVALKARVPKVTHPQAEVVETIFATSTVLPWSLLKKASEGQAANAQPPDQNAAVTQTADPRIVPAQATDKQARDKQALDAPLAVQTSLTVQHVSAKAQANVDDLSLQVKTKLYSLTGDKLDADVQLDIARVQNVEPPVVVPVKLSTRAEVRGSTYRLRGFALDIAELIKLTIDGSVAMKQSGMDLDVDMHLADLALDRVSEIAPPKVREQLAPLKLKGSVSADVHVKGPLPANAFKGDTEALVNAATPFVLDATLAWKAIALVSGVNVIDGVNGSIVLHTQPNQEKVTLATSVASVAAADQTTVRDVQLNVVGRYAAGLGGLASELKVGEVAAPKSLAIKLKNTTVGIDATYERGGTLDIDRFAVSVPSVGMTLAANGVLVKPERIVEEKVFDDPNWKGLQGELSAKLDINFPGELKPIPGPLKVSGGLGFDIDLSMNEGLAKAAGALRMNKLSLDNNGLVVTNVRGKLPFQQDWKRVSDGFVGVYSADDILRRKPRIAYYKALRSYGRDDDGLRIDKIVQGRTEISNFAMNARVEKGMLLVDYFGLNALSGDVVGQLAAQFSTERTVRLSLGAEFSDLDVSVLSKTTPGPDSQINGNMQLNLEWGEKIHEIDGTSFNLTRVGRTLLVKSLLALDPEEKNESLKKQRGQIEFYKIQIKLLRATIVHNTLNLDMDYGSIADYVGWKPINGALVRRLVLSDYLEEYGAEPMADAFGPILKWRTARKRGPNKGATR